MAIDLCDYEIRTKNAVKQFWGNRLKASTNQEMRGKVDQGERSGVTAGNNLNGFIDLLKEVVVRNGLPESNIQIQKKLLTLPGYFRPTKSWDFIVINNTTDTNEKQLIATIELKSQVGPSFGNNFNNRTEEAIGSALDFRTAFREGAFGDVPRPFLGWIMVVEECNESIRPVRDTSPHFNVMNDFIGASYMTRYEVLCRKLVQESLYTSAALISTPRESIKTGEYSTKSRLTSIETFVREFAGHIASVSAK